MDKEIEVILIEDNPDDAALAVRALKINNFANKLIHLKDGAEALDFFSESLKQGGQFKPKVILLDLKMPKVNGIEVLQFLKSDAVFKVIPVVILTSSAEDPDIKKCYELGANSYIVKPVDFENFSKAVVSLGMYWMLLNKTN